MITKGANAGISIPNSDQRGGMRVGRKTLRGSERGMRRRQRKEMERRRRVKRLKKNREGSEPKFHPFWPNTTRYIQTTVSPSAQVWINQKNKAQLDMITAQTKKEKGNTAPAEKHLALYSPKYKIPQKRIVGLEVKYIHLGKLVEKNKENLNQNGWVLDSGATNHITGNRTLLHNYQKNSIQDFVYVANGEKMKIHGYGTIKVFLKNIEQVLHIENCTFNLLSIGKLSQELSCEIIFSKKNVFFQDLKTKKMIGEESFQNGLYILNISKFGFYSKNQELGKIWHK
jgi:hypothetical protein